MTINEAMRTYRLPNPTTPEDLECRWSKVLNFGDKVLLAGYYYNGKNKPKPCADFIVAHSCTNNDWYKNK
jgi:hypothetical protein